MIKPSITHAMVFAAGYGMRMRPLTTKLPKPLIRVNHKPLLEYALDLLTHAHIPHAIINTHYHGEHIQHYIENRTASLPHITISHETTLLETGGGLKKVLNHLDLDSILTLNTDTILLEGPVPTLTRLLQHWNPEKMDMLLLLYPIDQLPNPVKTDGDFRLTQDFQLSRQSPCPYIYTGVQILKTSLLKPFTQTIFSLKELYHLATQKNGTLLRGYGLVHDGRWFHVGTPAELQTTEDVLCQISF